MMEVTGFCPTGEEPIIIFDREGRFIGTWEKEAFKRPHGLCFDPMIPSMC